MPNFASQYLTTLIRTCFCLACLAMSIYTVSGQERAILATTEGRLLDLSLEDFTSSLIKDLGVNSLNSPLMTPDSVFYFEFQKDEASHLGSYALSTDEFTDLGQLFFSSEQSLTQLVKRVDENTLLALVWENRGEGNRYYFYHIGLSQPLHAELTGESLGHQGGVLTDPLDGSLWSWNNTGSTMFLLR